MSDSINKIKKRSLRVVAISQLFSGFGIAAGISNGALILQKMVNNPALSGIPTMIFTIGSAVAAAMIATINTQYGRNKSISLGFFIGGIGSLISVFAAQQGHFILFLIALFFYGFGSATNSNSRFAATDLADQTETGKYISLSMVLTTFGAVFGSFLVKPITSITTRIGLDPLLSPFILAGFAYLISTLIIFTFLRPDPLVISRSLEKQQTHTANSNITNNNKMIILSFGILIVSQVVMLSIMSMTPVFLSQIQTAPEMLTLFISLHIAAMYLPSLFSGIVADKIGGIRLGSLGMFLFILTGIISSLVDPSQQMLVLFMLIVLGVAWNFGITGASKILLENTDSKTSIKMQSLSDVVTSIFGALAGAISGVLMTKIGFSGIGLIGITFSLITLILAMYSFYTKNNTDM